MGCSQGKSSNSGLQRAPTAPLGQSGDAKEARTLLNTPGTSDPAAVKTVSFGPAHEVVLGIFDGSWHNGKINHISTDKLTWGDGSISQIEVDGKRKKIVVSYHGETYTGQLFPGYIVDDDKIHWDDGDIWTRHQGRPAALKRAQTAMVDKDPKGLDPEEEVKADTSPTPLAFVQEEEPADNAPSVDVPAHTHHDSATPEAVLQPIARNTLEVTGPEDARGKPEAHVPTPEQQPIYKCVEETYTASAGNASDDASASQRHQATNTSPLKRPESTLTGDKRLMHSGSHTGSDISDTKATRKERNHCCC